MGQTQTPENVSTTTKKPALLGRVSFVIGLVSLVVAFIGFVLMEADSGWSGGLFGAVAVIVGGAIRLCCRFAAIPVSIAGLAVGIPGLRKEGTSDKYTTLGVVFNATALVLTIAVLVLQFMFDVEPAPGGGGPKVVPR